MVRRDVVKDETKKHPTEQETTQSDDVQILILVELQAIRSLLEESAKAQAKISAGSEIVFKAYSGLVDFAASSS